MCRENLIDFSNYEIHQDGTIISKHWNRPLKGRKLKGYLRVKLKLINGKQEEFQMHRVIWTYFNGDIPNGIQVNHIDENGTNNALNNLNLMTPKENCNYGTRNYRMAAAQSKIVLQIKSNGEIKEWTSTAECGRNGFNQGSVAAACRGEYSKQKHHYKDSEWYYK